MELISVNLGKEREINIAKDSVVTGIYKQPATTPVKIHSPGLEGDEISDKVNHGGLGQAVYVYGGADYGWWSKELGRELSPGTFGDNLTVSDLESGPMNVGDRLHIGDVVLEVTSPRTPCVKLATRMGDPQFVKRFREANRPGLYCRVIQPGTVQARTPVTVETFTGEKFSIQEFFEGFFDHNFSLDYLNRALAVPIDERSREYLQGELDKLLATE